MRIPFLRRKKRGKANARSDADSAEQTVLVADSAEVSGDGGTRAGSGGPDVHQPGETIGSDLLVKRCIDSGRMGYVYFGTHIRYNLAMAVKQPRRGGLYLDRLKKEAETWTRLGLHPHIACCYWVKEIKGWPYIFIEYVPGTTLKQWIRKGKCWDLAIGLNMAIQVAHALEHAHRQGVVHRDIKPDNILVDPQGNIKVTDFGLAGAATNAEGVSGRNRPVKGVGTPAYMPPEQWQNFHALGPAADIFSFGVCLWEMLVGARPYESTREPGPPRSIGKLRADIPDDLRELLLEMVAPAAEQRPARADRIIDRLNTIHHDLYGCHAPAFRIPAVHAGADNRNNQGVSFWELGMYARARKYFEKAVALEPTHPQANYNLGNEIQQQSHGAPLAAISSAVISLAVSPDSQQVAVAGLGPNAGSRVIALATGNTIHSLADCTALAFSPDTMTLARGGHGGRLELLTLDSGKTTDCGCLEGTITALAFSRDEQFMLAADTVGTVSLLDVSGRTMVYRDREHSAPVTAACFSPDNALFATGSRDGLVRVRDSGRPETVQAEFETGAPLSGLAFTPCGKKLFAATAAGAILLLEPATGKRTETGFRPGREINAMALAPDGKMLAAGCEDSSILCIDTSSMEIMRVLQGHGTAVTAVAFTPDNQLLVSADMAGRLRQWRRDTVCLVAPPRSFADLVQRANRNRRLLDHLDLLSNSGEIDHAIGRAVAAWEEDGCSLFSPFHAFLHAHWQELGAREIMETRLLTRILAEAGRPLAACFPPDGKELLLAWQNGLVQAMNLATGRIGTLSPGREKTEQVAAFSMNGTLLATIKNDGVIHLRQPARAEHGSEMGGQYQKATNMVFSKDGNVLAVVTPEGIHVGATRDPGQEPIRLGPKNGHARLALRPDGAILACISGGRDIVLYSTASGRSVTELQGPGQAASLAWSANGRYLAVGGDNGVLAVWDVKKGSIQAQLDGRDAPLTSLCWSADGRLVAAVDHEGRLFLGQVVTDTRLEKAAVPGPADSLVFAPNGRYLAVVGSADAVSVYCLLPKIHADSAALSD